MKHHPLTVHPAVLFSCFAAVLGFAMFLLHPLCLLLSLSGAVWCLLCLGGGNALKESIRVALPAGLTALVLGVLFNHRGQTVLFYLPGGNPCTLESLCYAAAACALLVSMLLWFSCCTRILTTDHFTYLFSRISPALALLFSMTLRFLPQFRRRFLAVRALQSEKQGRLQKLKAAFLCFFAVVAWALERAGETAASMKGRGYGLPGRTSFYVFSQTARDRLLLGGLAVCVLCVLCGCVTGLFGFTYSPALMAQPWTNAHSCAFLGFAVLCTYPVLILKLEEKPWRYSKSGT